MGHLSLFPSRPRPGWARSFVGSGRLGGRPSAPSLFPPHFLGAPVCRTVYLLPGAAKRESSFSPGLRRENSRGSPPPPSCPTSAAGSGTGAEGEREGRRAAAPGWRAPCQPRLSQPRRRLHRGHFGAQSGRPRAGPRAGRRQEGGARFPEALGRVGLGATRSPGSRETGFARPGNASGGVSGFRQPVSTGLGYGYGYRLGLRLRLLLRRTCASRSREGRRFAETIRVWAPFPLPGTQKPWCQGGAGAVPEGEGGAALAGSAPRFWGAAEAEVNAYTCAVHLLDKDVCPLASASPQQWKGTGTWI